MSYYINKKIEGNFNEIESKVKEALGKEGFGVLSEIEIHDKLKEKLDVDFRKYKILGACNPPYAYEALKIEDKIGTMLPCNVIIQQLNDITVEVAAVDPISSMIAVKNESLVDIAIEIQEKLRKVINSL